MKWKKEGLIFSPQKLGIKWIHSHAIQPTSIVLEDRITVYYGGRDNNGVSRIGSVDLNKNNPSEIINFSKDPILDIGEDGCFDENGVVPSAIVNKDGKIYLYYAGYQIGGKVRFTVLGGLAVSEDNGKSFKRCQRNPAFERTNEETLFRVPHSVIYEENKWKAWYGGGDHFLNGKDKTLPVYDIRYTESDTPKRFINSGSLVLTTSNDEYRIARPIIYKKSNNEFLLFYCYGSEDTVYKIGYAESNDCKNWIRKDKDFNLDISETGWDSEMIAYPNIFSLGNKLYMLYNGRSYGEEGFGLAEMLEF